MSSAGPEVANTSRFKVDPVVAGVILVLATHVLIRIFGTDNFGVDDTESTVNTQVFELYYALRNPPLFDWLYFAFQQVFGIGTASIQSLKAILLAGGAIFLYRAARPAFRERAVLAAAMVGYGTTGFYGWDVYEQFTHTVTFIFSIGFSLWALMRVVRSRGIGDYALLGIAIGVGLLSKYLFAVYFVALVVAAVLRPGYRPAILSARMGLAALVALVVLSPLLVGLGRDLGAATGTVTDFVVATPAPGRLIGFANFAAYSLLFWMPLAAILWACLRWTRRGTVEAPQQAGDPDFYPFLRDATLIMAGMGLGAVVLFDTDVGKARYLVPMLSLLPLAIFARVDRTDPIPAGGIRRFIRVGLWVIAAVAVVRFLIFLFVAPPFCLPKCRVFRDYGPLVEALARPDGKETVILTDDVHLGSNLLRLVPDARVVMSAYRGASGLPPAGPDGRVCYFVWIRDSRDRAGVAMEDALAIAIGRPPGEAELASIGPPAFVRAGWQAKLLTVADPDNVFGVAPIDPASALCNGG